MVKTRDGCVLRTLVLFLIVATVQVLCSASGYRPALALFTGEDVILESKTTGYAITYPGNWRVYQRSARGNPYQEVALFNRLMEGLIYLDRVDTSFDSHEEAIRWREDWYCSIATMFCQKDGAPWHVETAQFGDSYYPTTSLSVMTSKGEQYYYREAFVIRGQDLLIVGITARDRPTFEGLLPFYEKVTASLKTS